MVKGKFKTNNIDIITALVCAGHKIVGSEMDKDSNNVIVYMEQGDCKNTIEDDRIKFQNNELIAPIRTVLVEHKKTKDFVFDTKRNLR